MTKEERERKNALVQELIDEIDEFLEKKSTTAYGEVLCLLQNTCRILHTKGRGIEIKKSRELREGIERLRILDFLLNGLSNKELCREYINSKEGHDLFHLLGWPTKSPDQDS